MDFRLPNVVPAKKFLQRSFFNANKGAASITIDVPKGHFAVYVGECGKRRSVIPVTYLNQPSFQELLIEVEEEFGFDHPVMGSNNSMKKSLLLILFLNRMLHEPKLSI